MRPALIVAMFLLSATAHAADVGVTITASEPVVVAGTSSTWQIVVTNHGPDDAQTVTLTNSPPKTTFLSFASPVGWTCTTPVVGASGTIDCSAATIPAGATASFIATLHVDADADRRLTNSASISATNDTNEADNTSAVTSDLAQFATISLSSKAPATVVAGQSITYTVVATNNGPSVVHNPYFYGDFQPLLSVKSFSGPDGWVCKADDYCNGPQLVWPPRISQTFTLVVDVSPSAPNGSTITKTFIVNTPVPARAEIESSVLVSTSADLRITNSGPANAVATSTLAYTLDVTNTGPSDAQTVTLTDAIPAGATLLSLTQTSGQTFACTDATCTIATLASGAHATFALIVKAGETVGPASNVASLTSSTSDPNLANNSATAAVNIVAPIPALSPFALLFTAVVLAFAAIRRTV